MYDQVINNHRMSAIKSNVARELLTIIDILEANSALKVCILGDGARGQNSP